MHPQKPKKWQQTTTSNLLKNVQSGVYYARVKVDGKQKWRTLKTTILTVAQLKKNDFEKTVRAQAAVASGEGSTASAGGTNVGRFIAIYKQRIQDDASLAVSTKTRHETAVKALVKTWTELPRRDARRVTPTDCKEWAKRALRVGTGFVAPKAKTKRAGMAPSSFNKCVDTLRGVFEIVCEHGAAYENPATDLTKAAPRVKRLELPTAAQFKAIVKAVREAGARQSEDCGDMVLLLAYSGLRLAEACALRWEDVNEANSTLRVAGTKTETSYRYIPLFPALAAHLKDMQARRPDDTATSPILRVHECKGALASACMGVGVPRLTHHDLRHYFASRVIESGVDIPTLSKWLGHADGGALAMRVYGHLSRGHSQAQALKVQF